MVSQENSVVFMSKVKRVFTLEFLGETSHLLEKLLKVRFAVQDSIHRGVAAYLHKRYSIIYNHIFSNLIIDPFLFNIPMLVLYFYTYIYIYIQNEDLNSTPHDKVKYKITVKLYICNYSFILIMFMNQKIYFDSIEP